MSMQFKSRLFITSLLVCILLLIPVSLIRGQEEDQNGQPITESEPEAPTAVLAPTGSGFTYQGQLQESGGPANGDYDIEFSLYNAAVGGFQIGATISRTETITNGLFTTVLDFGSTPFNGEARHLQIGVRSAGGGSYTPLSPRQALTPVPYALYGEDDDWEYNTGTGLTGNIYHTGDVALGDFNDPDGYGLNVQSYEQGKAAVRGVDQNGENLYAEGQLGVLIPAATYADLPVAVVNIGVLGVKPDSGASGAGVYGWNFDDNATNYGGVFVANGSDGGVNDVNYGLYAGAANAATNWAGYFAGNTYITGTLEVEKEVIMPTGAAVGDFDTLDGHRLNVQNYTSGKAAVRGVDQAGGTIYAEGQLGVFEPISMPLSVTNIGVLGLKPANGGNGAGIYGWNNDNNSRNYAGVFISDGNGIDNYGIYAQASNGTTNNYAGFFDGHTIVNTGTLQLRQSVGNEMVIINDNQWRHGGSGTHTFGSGGNHFIIASKEDATDSAGIYGDGNAITIWAPGDGQPGAPNAALVYFLDEDRYNDNDGNPYNNSSIRSYITSAGAYVQVSDASQKQNITVIHSALDKINTLNGYVYEFAPNAEERAKEGTPQRHSGVLAQELQKVLPEAVKTADDGQMYVDYAAITPLLIEGMKEQQSEIETLRRENEQLQREIEAIKAHLGLEESRSPDTDETTHLPSGSVLFLIPLGWAATAAFRPQLSDREVS